MLSNSRLDFRSGIVPAFNLDKSNILFASNINFDKTAGDEGTLAKVVDNTESEWQLTIKDSTQNFSKNGKAKRSLNTVTVPYSYSYSGSGTNANQISIIITDKAYNEEGATVVYYGKGKLDNSTVAKSTSVQFTLPDNYDYDGESYKVYVFSEQVNGSKLTDYASNLVEIPSEELDFTPITTIELTVNAPEGGKALATTATCATQGVTESTPILEWSPIADKAGFGTVYTMTTTFTAKQDYKFISSTKATVNGKEAEASYNSETKQVTVTYKFDKTRDAKLISIASLSAISAVNGSPKTVAGLGLPEKITIETEDTAVNTASVDWYVNAATYDPSVKDKEQSFTVYGTVSLPTGIENSDKISLDVSVDVTVAAEGSLFMEINDVKDKYPEVDPASKGYVTVKLNKTSMVYTGAQLRPAVTVKYSYLEYNDNGVPKVKTISLKENSDYTLTYTNNINVSSDSSNPTITLKGIGDYTGTITKNFTITQKNIKSVKTEALKQFTYTGESLKDEIKAALIVKDGNYTLNPDTDYDLSFFEGTMPSEAIGNANADTVLTVYVNAKNTGNYTGSSNKKINVTILGTANGKINFTDNEQLKISFKKNLVQNPLIYNGKPQKPAVDVTLNGEKLAAKNYTLVYKNNINAGDTATVTVVGKNEYYGEKTISFSIQKKNFSKVSIKGVPKLTYRRTIEDLNPLVKDGSNILVKDVDYTMTADNITKVNLLGKNQNVLLLTFKASDNSNYTGEKTLKVTITKRALTNRLFTKVTVGEAKLTAMGATPEVTVKYNGEPLTAGTDYKLTYKNNTKLGTGQVVIEGIGNYTGKRTVKFTITQ